jgi:hypothetical protein
MNNKDLVIPFKWLLPYLYFFGRLITYLGLASGGLFTYGDLPRYYEIANLSGVPFFSYWVEYPPLFPFLNYFVYSVTRGNNPVYDFCFYLIFALSGSFCIYLFHLIAQELWGAKLSDFRTLLYFALLLPLPYTWWYFELIPVAFLLAALYLTNRNNSKFSGAILALGILAKLFPALLFPAIWKYKTRQFAAKTIIIALVITLLVIGGLYILSPQMTSTSLLSQPARSSWQTVWAWMEGNFTTGAFAYPENHYNPEYPKTTLGYPAIISPWLRFVAFGALGFYLFHKVKIKNAISFISFTGITWAIFLIWSSGWSPQWILYLIPLILLTLPVEKALFWNLILILLTLMEWPILLGHRLFVFMGPIALIRTVILGLLVYFWYQVIQNQNSIGTEFKLVQAKESK